MAELRESVSLYELWLRLDHLVRPLDYAGMNNTGAARQTIAFSSPSYAKAALELRARSSL
jgi:hypothetical protein